MRRWERQRRSSKRLQRQRRRQEGVNCSLQSSGNFGRPLGRMRRRQSATAGGGRDCRASRRRHAPGPAGCCACRRWGCSHFLPGSCLHPGQLLRRRYRCSCDRDTGPGSPLPSEGSGLRSALLLSATWPSAPRRRPGGAKKTRGPRLPPG